MDKKQYNNIIYGTIKREKALENKPLKLVRKICDNMGVALPQGDCKDILNTLKTNEFMSWRACSKQAAQQAANKGIAAIGISEDEIILLSAQDTEETAIETAAVMTLSTDASISPATMSYYSYGSGIICDDCFSSPYKVSGVKLTASSFEMAVGSTVYLSAIVSPSTALNKTVTWCSSNENVATVGLYTGKITAKMAGTTKITATTSDGGFKSSCEVTVNPLLIYQTRDTEVKWFNPDIENATEEIREDMLYNHWSKQEIKQNVPSIGDNMFEKNGQEISINDRKNSLVDMTTTYFANKTFEPIIKDMINHFMNETDDNFYGTCDDYNLYANSNLTQQVKNHSESEDYISKNKTALNRCLKNFNGSICNLKYNPSIRYDKELRKSHPFVAMADIMRIKLPVFDDTLKGFKICIDSLQSAKIEILSYNLVGNSYSGKMKITYYDHFGLDVADLNKDGIAGIIGDMNGFKNWFILQHYNDLNTNIHPKPFVTVIEIEESFSGEI